MNRRLRILMYHRILDPGAEPSCNPSVISATPTAFHDQIRFIAAHYRVLGVEEIVGTLRDGRPLPRRALLVTFDDGCRDFGEVAWPVLRRYRLPATVFVPTAYPDWPERSFWWDRLYFAFRCTPVRGVLRSPCGPVDLDAEPSRQAGLRMIERVVKTLPQAEAMALVETVCAQLGEEAPPVSSLLNWDELRVLAADGATIAAHTRTHPALTRLSTEEARVEIRQSRTDIEREIGSVPPVFAYPFGDHDDRIARLVQEEGFEVALTCRDGHSCPSGAEAFRCRRTNITPRTTALVFRARLTVIGSYLDRWRHAWRANRVVAEAGWRSRLDGQRVAAH